MTKPGVVSVLEMVEAQLRAGGYDGLFNEDNDCACELGDLNPCGAMEVGCMAGHKAPCNCGDHDWHIGGLVGSCPECGASHANEPACHACGHRFRT
jgi:hypothetical protein